MDYLDAWARHDYEFVQRFGNYHFFKRMSLGYPMYEVTDIFKHVFPEAIRIYYAYSVKFSDIKFFEETNDLPKAFCDYHKYKKSSYFFTIVDDDKNPFMEKHFITEQLRNELPPYFMEEIFDE